MRLGERELQILKTIAKENSGVAYWEIIYLLCKCRKSECKKSRALETCRVATTRALSSLKRKRLVYKKRMGGYVNYYLTREAKKFLLDLAGSL